MKWSFRDRNVGSLSVKLSLEDKTSMEQNFLERQVVTEDHIVQKRLVVL